MVEIKKVDNVKLSSLIREFNFLAELIRARQDEKQAVLDDFDSESKRYFFGKVSKNTLKSSASKTNKEISRLDKDIKKCISKAKKISNESMKMILNQTYKKVSATEKGIFVASRKK